MSAGRAAGWSRPTALLLASAAAAFFASGNAAVLSSPTNADFAFLQQLAREGGAGRGVPPAVPAMGSSPYGPAIRLFAAILAPVPPASAPRLFRIVAAAAVVAACAAWLRVFPGAPQAVATGLLAGSSMPLAQGLSAGNFSLLQVPLCMLALARLAAGPAPVAALAFGALLAAKIAPLLLVPVWFLVGGWRALFLVATGFAAATAAAVAVYGGPVIGFGSGLLRLSTDPFFYTGANQSWPGVAAHLAGWSPARPGWASGASVLAAGCLALATALAVRRSASIGLPRRERVGRLVALFAAASLCAGPVSWYHYYVCLLPVVPAFLSGAARSWAHALPLAAALVLTQAGDGHRGLHHDEASAVVLGAGQLFGATALWAACLLRVRSAGVSRRT